MTLKYELTKKIKKKGLVAVCVCCEKQRIKGEWIEAKKIPYYHEYTGTFCPECLNYALEYNGNGRKK